MTESQDPYDLERFVAAQEAHHTYARAVAELRAGRKTGHWMWFVFPQIAGLGMSAMSQRYAIRSLDEARAYRRHPVLGPRLLTCAEVMVGWEGRSAEEILGGIDALKLRSCATLFAQADPSDHVFTRVLDVFFDGVADGATVNLV
jgi:uncharacterized protein (DUF1810 family)